METWLPLQDASEAGELERVEIILEQYPDCVNTPCGLWGRTAMHIACENGHLDIVRVLLNHGADPNQYGGDGWGPIHYAARKGHLRVVEYLLGKGIVVNCSTVAEQPLLLAIRSKHNEVTKLLLRHGASIHAEGRQNIPGIPESKRMPMFYAVQSGNVEIVDVLLDAGAELVIDKRGKSALHLAAEHHLGMVQHLLTKGLDKELVDEFSGKTPLHVAVGSQKTEIISFLLDIGADIDTLGSIDETPLHLASHPEIIDLLLSRGARYDITSSGNRTALDEAVCNFRYAKVKALLVHGATVSSNLRPLNKTVIQYMLMRLPLAQKLMKYTMPVFQCLKASGYPFSGETWIVDNDYLSGTELGRNIVAWLREQRRHPLSLTQLAIIATRKRLSLSNGGRSILDSIDKLCVPSTLKEELKFEHVGLMSQ